MTRYFQIGASKFKDLASSLPFSDAYELFCKQYPIARHSMMFESDGIPQDDGSVLYKVPLLPAKHNG